MMLLRKPEIFDRGSPSLATRSLLLNWLCVNSWKRKGHAGRQDPASNGYPSARWGVDLPGTNAGLILGEGARTYPLNGISGGLGLCRGSDKCIAGGWPGIITAATGNSAPSCCLLVPSTG
jgi:hypothetical protein